jgi:hypothetical protein
MQTELRKLRYETIAITDLRTYSDRSRAAKLGDLQFDFTEDAIHEAQGITGINDVIFRFAILLLSPENQTSEAISALINNPGHTDFLENKIALYRAITDLIAAIKTDSMTNMRSYLSVYDNIDAVASREGWISNFLPHLISAQRALLTGLSATEVIANDQRITEEQRTEILEKLEGKTDNSLVAEVLIMLCCAHISITDKILDTIITYSKSPDFAPALSQLIGKNIILTQPILDAFQNKIFVQMISLDEKKIDIDYRVTTHRREGHDGTTHIFGVPVKFVLTQSVVDLLASLVAANRHLSPLIAGSLTELQNHQIAITQSIRDVFFDKNSDQHAMALISLLQMDIPLTPFVLDKLVTNKNIMDVGQNLMLLWHSIKIENTYPIKKTVHYYENAPEREGAAFAYCVLNEYHRWKYASRPTGLFSCSSERGRSDESAQIIQALDDFVRGNKNALETVKSITPGSRLKGILDEFGLLKNDKLDIAKLHSRDLHAASTIELGNR